MTKYQITQPVSSMSLCRWCGERQDEDHPLCEEALRNLGLGYCTECGENVGPADEVHEACIYASAIKAGRPDLLDPPSDADLAWLARLTRAIEDEVARIDGEGADGWRRQAAPWN